MLKSWKVSRRAALVGVAALCFAQAPQQPSASGPPPDLPRRSDIVTNVNVVIAPTTVLTHNGEYVNGLTINDFKLFDNGKPQRINADIAYQPMSMVVAVQASAKLTDILPKIQKIGVMLDDLVVGQGGEMAVVAFDHRIRTLQDFTTDPGKVEVAMKSIVPGSYTSALIDATSQSIRMLKQRPSDHRKILLLISEKRDQGSEGRLRETLDEAQEANVSIYSIDISHLMAQLTGTPEPPRPDPIPATAIHVPAGAPQVPSTVDIPLYSGNYIPLFVDIFKGVKSIFVDDTLDVFTRYTGGKEYSFVSEKSLEKAVTSLGEELHSQYLLSYVPNDQNEGGFHQIRVEVDRPRLEVRTRTGYWAAARQ